jgi:predicted class III extradiol MEMO1 family dioxygenase
MTTLRVTNKAWETTKTSRTNIIISSKLTHYNGRNIEEEVSEMISLSRTLALSNPQDVSKMVREYVQNPIFFPIS